MATHAVSHFDQSQHLARMEHQRSYASNQAAIAALELVTAMSTVLTRRLGEDFAAEMCAELRKRVDALEAHDVNSQCTATIVAELAAWPLWKTAGLS